ncbi:MAG: hypothetical protein WED07_00530 [Candidatus Freyarchaeum deiterrae]
MEGDQSESKLTRFRRREQLDSLAALIICALAAIGVIILLLIVSGYLVWKPF